LLKISDQTGNCIHQKVNEKAMMSVFKVKNLLQRIIDSLDETEFSEEMSPQSLTVKYTRSHENHPVAGCYVLACSANMLWLGVRMFSHQLLAL